MKKASIMTVSIIVTIVLSLIIFNQFIERSIRTEIIVNAPTEKVWQVLLDHESYNEWNPFIKSINGSTNEGEILEVTIQGKGNDPMIFKPMVLENDENKEFRWIGVFLMKGVVDGEHYFILEDVGSNKTRFIHGETFSGILSGVFMSMIGESTHIGFIEMNEALKKESEKNR